MLEVGRLVEANKQSLARLVTREIGKPYAVALGEVQEVIDTCDFFLGEGRGCTARPSPARWPTSSCSTFRVPIGAHRDHHRGQLPHWPCPPGTSCQRSCAATRWCDWKPAETSAAVAHALLDLFRNAGVAGVLDLVLTDGPTTSEGLQQALAAGTVDKIGFTGSTAVGPRDRRDGRSSLASACLELGGKNPLVVLPDADLDLAVEGALFSGFGTAGQRCTSLGTAWVHREAYDEFKRRFVAAVEGAVVGDPFADVLYGPMLSPRYLDNHEKNLALALDRHALLGSTGVGRITRANPRQGFVGDPDRGVFAHPTIVEGIEAGDALYDTETFGPLVGLGTFDTFDEAVELASGHGYGLSAAIYTRDAKLAFDFRARCGAGMVSVNNSTSGAEAHLPFGGNGRSGNGSRQSGIWVLDQFTRWQAMNWDVSGHLQKAQMDTLELPYDLRASGSNDRAARIRRRRDRGRRRHGASIAFHLAEAGRFSDVSAARSRPLGCRGRRPRRRRRASAVRGRAQHQAWAPLAAAACGLRPPARASDRPGAHGLSVCPEHGAGRPGLRAGRCSAKQARRRLPDDHRHGSQGPFSALLRTDDLLAASWSPADEHLRP